jgi:hypothetical protein
MPKSQRMRSSIASNDVPSIQPWLQRISTWTCDFADQPSRTRLADIGEVRRPAAVLVHGELEPAALRQLDQFAAVIEVLDEGFLRQHVLMGVQGAPHEIKADVRVGCEIENTHVWVAQKGIEIIGDAGAGKIGLASGVRTSKIARADRDDVQATVCIGVEMRAADAAGANQRDRDATVARHRRVIRKVRRFNLDCRLGD